MKKNYWVVFLLFFNSIELRKIEVTGGYHKYTNTYMNCAGYRIVEKGKVYDFHFFTRQKFKIKQKNIDTKFVFRPLFWNYERYHYKNEDGNWILKKSERIKEPLYWSYIGIAFFDYSQRKAKISMDLGINLLHFKIRLFDENGKGVLPLPGASLTLNFYDFLFPSIHFFDYPSSGIYINSIGYGTYLDFKKFGIGGYIVERDTLILSFKLNSPLNTYFIANIKGPFKFFPSNKYYSNFGIGINF